MATLNRVEPNTLVTHEGAPAKRITPLQQLERSVMSCLLWEDEFYEDGKAIASRISELVKQVDPFEVAKLAARAKNDMKLRHVPLLLARELVRTEEGRALTGQLFREVIRRADEPGEFLSLYWKDNKDEPLAKQVKKHLGESLRQFDEYQLAKYNGGQKAVKLRDVLRITRPKPASPEQAELWKKVVKGELATPDTWEVELSKSQDKKASWERLLTEGKLGGLAMLRNVRNMTQAGVSAESVKVGIARIQAGRLLPVNFIASARANPQYEPELEAKFFECFSSREKIGERTIVLIDVSGSMDAALSSRSEMRRLDVACSLAMVGREMFSDLRVMTFSDALVEVPPRRGFALRDAVVRSQPHGGTALGMAVKAMPDCDRLVVITDEQSRDTVPDRRGYMINVASARNGVGYGSWVNISGWSDKVLDYVVRYEQSFGGGR